MLMRTKHTKLAIQGEDGTYKDELSVCVTCLKNNPERYMCEEEKNSEEQKAYERAYPSVILGKECICKTEGRCAPYYSCPPDDSWTQCVCQVSHCDNGHYPTLANEDGDVNWGGCPECVDENGLHLCTKNSL